MHSVTVPKYAIAGLHFRYGNDGFNNVRMERWKNVLLNARTCSSHVPTIAIASYLYWLSVSATTTPSQEKWTYVVWSKSDKSGLKIMYADDSFINGQTRSVPPPGFTLESDIHPWNERNMEQPPREIKKSSEWFSEIICFANCDYGAESPTYHCN